MGRPCECCRDVCHIINFIPVQYFEIFESGVIDINDVNIYGHENFAFFIAQDLLNPIKYDYSDFTQIPNNEIRDLYLNLCDNNSPYPKNLYIYNNSDLLYKDEYNYIANSFSSLYNNTVGKCINYKLRDAYDRGHPYKNGDCYDGILSKYVFHSGNAPGRSLIDLSKPYPYNSSIYTHSGIYDANTGSGYYPELYRPNCFKLGSIEGKFDNNDIITSNIDMCSKKTYSFASAYSHTSIWLDPCIPEGTGAFFSSDIEFKNTTNANVKDLIDLNPNSQVINYPILYKIIPPELPPKLNLNKRNIRISWNTTIVKKDSYSVPSVDGCDIAYKVGDNAKEVAEMYLSNINGSVLLTNASLYSGLGEMISYISGSQLYINNFEIPAPDFDIFKTYSQTNLSPRSPIIPKTRQISLQQYIGAIGQTSKQFYSFLGGTKNNGVCFSNDGSQYACVGGFYDDPVFYSIDPSIVIETQLLINKIGPTVFNSHVGIEYLHSFIKGGFSSDENDFYSSGFANSINSLNNYSLCENSPLGVSSYKYYIPVEQSIHIAVDPLFYYYDINGNLKFNNCNGSQIRLNPFDSGYAYGYTEYIISLE